MSEDPNQAQTSAGRLEALAAASGLRRWTLAGRELLPVVQGMWLANSILLPIGLFFLYQAWNDSSLLELEPWRRFINKLKRNKL